MDTKIVYSYRDSGLYSGIITLNNTDKDPLGNWNIPYGCTELVPPDYKEGYNIYFINNEWIYVAIPTKKYVIRNGNYMYDYYQDGDIIVTERPTPLNTYTSYEWGTISAKAGKISCTITKNFAENDTLTIAGVTFTIGTDVIGTDIATTATNLKAVLSANTTINTLYTVAVSGETITLIETVAGGGNTPSEAVVTGTGTIINGTATTSTPETTGWKIDLATSLDALNSSYITAKSEIHKQHSGVILANWLTTEQITTAEENLKLAYKTLHDQLIVKQEALKNG